MPSRLCPPAQSRAPRVARSPLTPRVAPLPSLQPGPAVSSAFPAEPLLYSAPMHFTSRLAPLRHGPDRTARPRRPINQPPGAARLLEAARRARISQVGSSICYPRAVPILAAFLTGFPFVARTPRTRIVSFKHPSLPSAPHDATPQLPPHIPSSPRYSAAPLPCTPVS